MSIADYATRCAELGINRGQLDTGFENDPKTFSHEAMGWACIPVGERIQPPPVEIPAHLVGPMIRSSPGKRMLLAIRNAKPEMKPFYRLLYNRGLKLKDIAEKTGLSVPTVTETLRGAQKRATHRGKIRAVLTEEERKVVGW